MSDSQTVQKYPNYPPYDCQVQFYQSSTLRLNPTSSQKQAKTCPKCQFPIQIRILIKPCLHYLCYDCYAYSKNQCAYCSTVACQVVKLDDKAKLYTCDMDCYKVFENEEILKRHLSDHATIKAETVTKNLYTN